MVNANRDFSPRRTLIFGSDGLRPDSLAADLMPTYSRLSREGTLFRRFSSIYPSETRVAMTSFTTGVYPGKHGIVANHPYLPGFGKDGYLQTGNHRHLQAYQKQFGKPVVLRPTLGDRLHAVGKHLSVAGNGSPGSTLLWNLQHPEKVLNPNTDFGVSSLQDLHKRLGPPPSDDFYEILDWITLAFIENQLPDTSNAAMVLWLAQPDKSAHSSGLGSPGFLKALRCVDDCLKKVVDALSRRGEEVDLLLLSDHGHSSIDACGSLDVHILTACRELELDPRLLSVSAQAIYCVNDISDKALQKLVGWIKGKPWCGSIYVNHPCAEQWEALPVECLLGTIYEDRAPLIIINPTWSPEMNKFGVPGVMQLMVDEGWSTHGNAVPTDMQAFCVGWGPGFRKGHESEIPAGVVDIAPTICYLQGIHGVDDFDGRILYEGLAGDYPMPSWTISVEGSGRQRQPLHVARVLGTRYILGCEA